MAYVRKKSYPCIRCRVNIPKTGVAAIQCNVCELWLHKQCPGRDVPEVSEDLYTALNAQKTLSGGAYWACDSCRASFAKLNARVLALDKVVDGLQKKVTTHDSEIEALKKEVAAIKQDAKDASAKAKPDAVKETVTGAVFKEMRERDAKRYNVVVQGLAEAPRAVTDGKARRDFDLAKLQDMLNVLELECDVSRKVRTATRLGKKGDAARPLLVTFRESDDQAAVLDSAKKLNSAEMWKSVRVLQDLTKIQRQEEKLLRQEADVLAAQLSDDESKNWMFRVVGRRGARRVAKVPIRLEAACTNAAGGPRPARRKTNARASPARVAASPPAATSPRPLETGRTPTTSATQRPVAAVQTPPRTPTAATPETPSPLATQEVTPPAETQEVPPTAATQEVTLEENPWIQVPGYRGGRRSARVQTRAQATTTAATPSGQATPVTQGRTMRGLAPKRGKSKRGQ